MFIYSNESIQKETLIMINDSNFEIQRINYDNNFEIQIMTYDNNSEIQII
jgi:hypothetical protein